MASDVWGEDTGGNPVELDRDAAEVTETDIRLPAKVAPPKEDAAQISRDFVDVSTFRYALVSFEGDAHSRRQKAVHMNERFSLLEGEQALLAERDRHELVIPLPSRREAFLVIELRIQGVDASGEISTQAPSLYLVWSSERGRYRLVDNREFRREMMAHYPEHVRKHCEGHSHICGMMVRLEDMTEADFQ